MRLRADRDYLDAAGRRVDVIDDVVVTAGKPKLLPVRTDIAHIGAAAARDRPISLDLAGREVDDRNAARSMRAAVDPKRAAVGYIELCAAPARIKPVRADAGGDEVGLGEGIAIDQVHAIRAHIGNVKGGTVGRDPDVLRHSFLASLR